MNHVTQGYNECVLATIAALSDTPIDVIRRIAQEFTGADWADFLFYKSGCSELDKAIEHICSHVGLPPVISHLSSKITTGSGAPDLSGKGQLIFGFNHNGIQIGLHSVAYENGLIYDGTLICPVTWESVIKHYTEVKGYEVFVAGVYPIEKTTKPIE